MDLLYYFGHHAGDMSLFLCHSARLMYCISISQNRFIWHSMSQLCVVFCTLFGKVVFAAWVIVLCSSVCLQKMTTGIIFCRLIYLRLHVWNCALVVDDAMFYRADKWRRRANDAAVWCQHQLHVFSVMKSFSTLYHFLT